MSWKIFFVERNIHGAWSVWGALGVKQYIEKQELYKRPEK